MKYYFTRFLLSYPKVIVYMLQSSEYNIAEYVKWLRRTKDFRKVILKRNLGYTKKSKLLLLTAWLIVMFAMLIIIGLVYLAFQMNQIYLIGLALLLFIFMPYFVSNGVIVPLFIGQILIQRPTEKIMTHQAKGTIEKHSAFKIAIAGSYGKTTAKDILNTILSEGKKVACTPEI